MNTWTVFDGGGKDWGTYTSEAAARQWAAQLADNFRSSGHTYLARCYVRKG
jgi:hypothetical protein